MPCHAHATRRRPADEAGFTLMELLTSMTVTLIVVGLTLSAFTEAQRANSLAGLVLDTNQNLRAGLNFMVRDLVQTGTGIPTGGIPVPSGAGATPINRPGPNVAMTFPVGDVVLQALTPGAALGPTLNGQQTDMVTVLYLDPSLDFENRNVTAIAADGSWATVDPLTDITGADNGVQVGDLIMFSNSMGYAIQAVTGTDGAQTMQFAQNDLFNLNQPNAAGGSITSILAGGTPTPDRVRMVTFSLDDTNPQVPTLMRQDGFDQARPIALVIENVQMSYDLVDGVTNPTNVKTPVPPNSPAQIRKVNLFLAARSESRSIAQQELFRTNLSTQVSLRSLAFVDRYAN